MDERPESPVESADAEMARRLRSVVSRLGKALRATAAGEGLSPSALDALGTVVRRGPIRPSDLAVAEALNPTMLSRLLAKLEERQLVRRLAGLEDGRSYALEPTTAGRQLHEQVLAERLEVIVTALSGLDPEQQAAVTAALPGLEALTEQLWPPTARSSR